MGKTNNFFLSRETRTSPKRHKLLISDCDIPKISADSYESAEGNASNSTKKMVPKPQSGAVTPKRSYIHLSEKEKLEILNLIEQEFNRMLADKGGINESVSVILERLKYKNYSPHCIMYNWRKLTITASDRSKSPTPVQRKVLRLLKLYRENKVNTKVNIFSDVSNSKQDPIKKACSPPEKTNSLRFVHYFQFFSN